MIESASAATAAALVTGASGAIGQAIARRLAALGHHVCVHYATDETAALRVVEGIVAEGGRAFAWRADLTRAEDVAAMFDAVGRVDERLEVLVNNAAVNAPKPLAFVTDDDLLDAWEVNVLGAFRCLRAAARRMARAGRGAIVNIGSLSAHRPLLGQVAYASTKGALEGMTRAAALELAQFGITVNLVAPGPVEGGMLDRLKTRGPRAVSRRTPLARAPSPEDVAAYVAFLCSKEARHLTGQILWLDGGLGLTTGGMFPDNEAVRSALDGGEEP